MHLAPPRGAVTSGTVPPAPRMPRGWADTIVRTLELRTAASALPAYLVFSVVLALHVAVFANAISYLPAEADDLRLISAAVRVDNPLELLTRDAGLKNPVYRPLLSMSLWAVHEVFGVRSWPNQLLGLLLHFVNLCLLVWILLRSGVPRLAVLGGSALAVSSIYTVSPVVWVADRATLMTAFCMLLLVAHAIDRGAQQRELSATLVAIASATAVLSKESGVIVPVLALLCAAGLHRHGTRAARLRVAFTATGILAGYGAVRLAIFGWGALGYDESGYLLATWHYDSAAHLARGWHAWAAVENVLKNMAAVALPIFDNEGGFLDRIALIKLAPIWIPTAVLAATALRRPWTSVHRLAFALIVLNAVVHYAAFRHRVEYIAWFGLCLCVAASSGLTTGRLRLATAAALFCAVLGGLAYGTAFVADGWLYRHHMLRDLHLAPLQNRYPRDIDRALVERILRRYADQPVMPAAVRRR
ncbi:MAG TPA: hypothetical protein VIL25_07150 [Vicinamibacterales bacterium]